MKLLRCLLLPVLLALAAPAWSADDPFIGFASQSFDDVAAAVSALAGSGNPRAQQTITALREENLYATPDGAILIKSDDGYVDARTGAKVAEVDEDSLANVRVNNAVRRAVDAALGSLDLFSVNAATRRAAAGAVLKSRDPAALPALGKALARESNPDVRAVMEQARPAATLASKDASEADRLAAVATLRARGDLEARGMLASLSGQPAAVAAAAATAVTAIDRMLQLWGLA